MSKIINSKDKNILFKFKDFKCLSIIGLARTGKTTLIKELLPYMGNNPLIIFPDYHGENQFKNIDKDLDIYYHSKDFSLSEKEKTKILDKMNHALKNNQDIIIDEINSDFKLELINNFLKKRHGSLSKLIITIQSFQDLNDSQIILNFDKILIGRINSLYDRDLVNKLLGNDILNDIDLSKLSTGNFISL